jgi:hypothetical protein
MGVVVGRDAVRAPGCRAGVTGDPDGLVTLSLVGIFPASEECGERRLPGDTKWWRAMFLDDGPEDRLGFWCADCWECEFG